MRTLICQPEADQTQVLHVHPQISQVFKNMIDSPKRKLADAMDDCEEKEHGIFMRIATTGSVFWGERRGDFAQTIVFVLFLKTPDNFVFK